MKECVCVYVHASALVTRSRANLFSSAWMLLYLRTYEIRIDDSCTWAQVFSFVRMVSFQPFIHPVKWDRFIVQCCLLQCLLVNSRYVCSKIVRYAILDLIEWTAAACIYRTDRRRCSTIPLYNWKSIINYWNVITKPTIDGDDVERNACNWRTMIALADHYMLLSHCDY